MSIRGQSSLVENREALDAGTDRVNGVSSAADSSSNDVGDVQIRCRAGSLSDADRLICQL